MVCRGAHGMSWGPVDGVCRGGVSWGVWGMSWGAWGMSWGRYVVGVCRGAHGVCRGYMQGMSWGRYVVGVCRGYMESMSWAVCRGGVSWGTSGMSWSVPSGCPPRGHVVRVTAFGDGMSWGYVVGGMSWVVCRGGMSWRTPGGCYLKKPGVWFEFVFLWVISCLNTYGSTVCCSPVAPARDVWTWNSSSRTCDQSSGFTVVHIINNINNINRIYILFYFFYLY